MELSRRKFIKSVAAIASIAAVVPLVKSVATPRVIATDPCTIPNVITIRVPAPEVYSLSPAQMHDWSTSYLLAEPRTIHIKTEEEG
jgi:hypothetical protein